MEQDVISNNLRIKFLVKWFSIALGLVVLYLLAFTYLIDKRPFVEWTLIKGNPSEAVASSQLIKLPDGKVFLIDAGDASGSLLPYLKKQKIKDIDLLILSSPSIQATSGLLEMVRAGIRILKIQANLKGGENTTWENIRNQVSRKGIPIHPLESGMRLFQLAESSLEVVAIKDAAVVLRLQHGKNSLLVSMGQMNKAPQPLVNIDCNLLKADILLNYVNASSVAASELFPGCLVAKVDLSRELGTFKILLKGDSFKWKRGR